MLNDGFPRLLLLPVTGSMPTIQKHLAEHTDDYIPDEDEVKEMLQMAINFLKTAPLLELYSKAVYGEPGMN